MKPQRAEIQQHASCDIDPKWCALGKRKLCKIQTPKDRCGIYLYFRFLMKRGDLQ